MGVSSNVDRKINYRSALFDLVIVAEGVEVSFYWTVLLFQILGPM